MPIVILKFLLLGVVVFIGFWIFYKSERKKVEQAKEHPMVKLYARKYSIARNPFVKLNALKVLLEKQGVSFGIDILKKAVREELLLIKQQLEEAKESKKEIKEEKEMIEEAHKLEDFLREESIVDELTDAVEEGQVSYVSGLEDLHEKRKHSLEYLKKLKETNFISFMKNLFAEIGYKPISVKNSPVGGVYYLLEKTDGTLAAYVHNGEESVDKTKLQKFSEFTSNNDINEMLAISLQGFDDEAKLKAKDLSIKLWDSYKLNQLINAFKINTGNVDAFDSK